MPRARKVVGKKTEPTKAKTATKKAKSAKKTYSVSDIMAKEEVTRTTVYSWITLKKIKAEKNEFGSWSIPVSTYKRPRTSKHP